MDECPDVLEIVSVEPEKEVRFKAACCRFLWARLTRLSVAVRQTASSGHLGAPTLENCQHLEAALNAHVAGPILGTREGL